MAKTIQSDNVAVPAWQPFAVTAVVGVLVGVLSWAASVLLKDYGDIGIIITSTLALFALIRATIARPLLPVLGSAVVLWGLGMMTRGLPWAEVLGWFVLLFGLSYIFFASLARIERTWLSIGLATVTVVVIRIALVLS